MSQFISDLIYDWVEAVDKVLISTQASPEEIKAACKEVVYQDVIAPDFQSSEPVILRQVLFGATPIAQLIRRGTVFEIKTGANVDPTLNRASYR